MKYQIYGGFVPNTPHLSFEFYAPISRNEAERFAIVRAMSGDIEAQRAVKDGLLKLVGHGSHGLIPLLPWEKTDWLITR